MVSRIADYDKPRFISYILRLTDRIDLLKTQFGNSRSQWQERNDFLTRGKLVSSNQEAAVKTHQVFNERGSFVDGASFFTALSFSLAGILAFLQDISRRV